MGNASSREQELIKQQEETIRAQRELLKQQRVATNISNMNVHICSVTIGSSSGTFTEMNCPSCGKRSNTGASSDSWTCNHCHIDVHASLIGVQKLEELFRNNLNLGASGKNMKKQLNNEWNGQRCRTQCDVAWKAQRNGKEDVLPFESIPKSDKEFCEECKLLGHACPQHKKD